MGAAKNKVTGRLGFINHTGYKLFKKAHPSTDISYQDYIAILKESNECIKQHILTNELGFKLPQSLGYVAVDKFKPSKRHVAVDWINTRRLGKLVPLTNMHSFGYVYKIKLYKNERIRPLLAYKMDAHRMIKRELAQNIKQEKQNYITIDRSYYSKRFRIDHIFKTEQ